MSGEKTKSTGKPKLFGNIQEKKNTRKQWKLRTAQEIQFNNEMLQKMKDNLLNVGEFKHSDGEQHDETYNSVVLQAAQEMSNVNLATVGDDNAQLRGNQSMAKHRGTKKSSYGSAS